MDVNDLGIEVVKELHYDPIEEVIVEGETATQYTKRMIDFYGDIFIDGGGKKDLDQVIKCQGINIDTGNVMAFLWKTLEEWFNKSPHKAQFVSDCFWSYCRIAEINQSSLTSDQKVKNVISAINHGLNKYTVVGLMKRWGAWEIKVGGKPTSVFTYKFTDKVVDKGLDWIVTGNLYFKGTLQPGGRLFN